MGQPTDTALRFPLTVTNESDIPKSWPRLKAKKKTFVEVRPARVSEEFAVDWQTDKLTSNPDTDVIVIGNGQEWPCRKDIFTETYEPADGPKWRKKAETTLVPIASDFDVTIQTLEGTLTKVSAPDYIVVGSKGELYANSQQFVTDNLEIQS